MDKYYIIKNHISEYPLGCIVKYEQESKRSPGFVWVTDMERGPCHRCGCPRVKFKLVTMDDLEFLDQF